MGEVVGLTEGARRATGGKPTTGGQVGPLEPDQRWSLRRKRDVVLRLLRGESVQLLSRELGVEIYRLEQWRSKALAGIETALKEREGDPLKRDLDQALKRIGELSMENELLRMRVEKQGPFGKGRSRK
ncbi:MAG: IS3 family transposase [Thermodesulfobacteriota bacterium]